MFWLIVTLVVFFLVVRTLKRQRLSAIQPHSPIEPVKPGQALPVGEPHRPLEPGSPGQPAIRDGKATVETLADDFAEGRISVEEYERRLDQLFRQRPT